MAYRNDFYTVNRSRSTAMGLSQCVELIFRGHPLTVPVHRGFDRFLEPFVVRLQIGFTLMSWMIRSRSLPQVYWIESNYPSILGHLIIARGWSHPILTSKRWIWSSWRRVRVFKAACTRAILTNRSFLFHSMQAVHLPSFPSPRFQGKTDF